MAPRQPLQGLTSRLGQLRVFGATEDLSRLEALLDLRLDATPEPPLRVPLWRVGAALLPLANEGAVICCGLARSMGRAVLPHLPYSVSVPSVVAQTLRLSDTPTLSGRERQGARRALRDLDGAGLGERLVHSRADLEQFYRDLYVPHVTKRHGDRALVVDLDRHWTGWIQRGGGLLLLSLGGRLAAGAFVMLAGRRALMGEEGVNHDLAGNPHFEVLQVALKRAVISWATRSGATELTMGTSPAAAANGVYRSKRFWRARPHAADRSLLPEWTFLAHGLPRPFRDHLNARRLVAFDRSRPLVVRFLRSDGNYDGPERSTADLVRDGFEGVLDVGPGVRSVTVFNSATQRDDAP